MLCSSSLVCLWKCEWPPFNAICRSCARCSLEYLQATVDECQRIGLVLNGYPEKTMAQTGSYPWLCREESKAAANRQVARATRARSGRDQQGILPQAVA
eukprot:scaffold927_cov375-Prasinococcus_capsulatus_cf.AAC.14